MGRRRGILIILIKFPRFTFPNRRFSTLNSRANESNTNFQYNLCNCWIFSYRLKTTRESYAAATNSRPGPLAIARCSGMEIPQYFSEISSCDEERFVIIQYKIVYYTFQFNRVNTYQDKCIHVLYLHIYRNDSIQGDGKKQSHLHIICMYMASNMGNSTHITIIYLNLPSLVIN